MSLLFNFYGVIFISVAHCGQFVAHRCGLVVVFTYTFTVILQFNGAYSSAVFFRIRAHFSMLKAPVLT